MSKKLKWMNTKADMRAKITFLYPLREDYFTYKEQRFLRYCSIVRVHKHSDDITKGLHYINLPKSVKVIFDKLLESSYGYGPYELTCIGQGIHKKFSLNPLHKSLDQRGCSLPKS